MIDGDKTFTDLHLLKKPSQPRIGESYLELIRFYHLLIMNVNRKLQIQQPMD